MKHLTLTLCAALLSIGSLQAQKALILQSPDVMVEYQLIKISPNGKWACGNINDGYYHSFRWDLTTGEFRELSPQGATSNALAVSNDGTVVGTFLDDEYLDNGGTIEAAGYWKNGRWHHLNSSTLGTPTDDTAGSQAQAISPNGKYIGGIGMYDGKWTPLVWDIEAGTVEPYIFKNPDGTGSAGSIYAVADNGMACGYVYRTSRSNRTPCIWTTPNDTILPAYDLVGPYCVANAITADGSKVLAYDRVFDVATRTATKAISFDDYMSFELFGLCGNGDGIVGYAKKDIEGSSEAIYIKDGKITSVSTLLKENGADLSKYPQIIQAVGISDDEKTFGLMAYDSDAIPRAVVVKLDANTDTPSPVRLAATPLYGAAAVQLTWHEPLANASAVKGYDIYRDGTKVNDTPVTALRYIDGGLADGNYTYTIKAVYAEAESEASEAATAALTPAKLQAPEDLVVVQRGYNNVRILWNAPKSTLPTYTYADSTSTIYSIGGGSYNMEIGVRLHSDVLAAYAGKGQQIMDVAFYPMSLQNEWKINLYTIGSDTTLVYSQAVAGSDLRIGELNTIRLTTPFTPPTDKDLIVGVEAIISQESYSVFGVQHGICEAGYTDLIRRVGVEDFYSMQEHQLADEEGSMMYEYTWPVAVSFSTPEASATAAVKNYNLYVDGTLKDAPTTGDYTLSNVSDGSHTYSVSAINSADEEGPVATTQLSVSRNADAYKPQNIQVSVDGQNIRATWDAATDDNHTVLSYSSDNCAGATVGTFMAKTLYSGSILRTVDGYQVKALRFYPTAKADFTLYLEKDGKTVATAYPESYEIGEWNEVKLESPVTIDRNSEYALIVDCYDVQQDKGALGQDDQLALQGTSDLYSTNEGEDYSSLSAAGGKNANWMMGLTLGTAETSSEAVKGYNVLIDEEKVTPALLSETACDYTMHDDVYSSHALQVEAVLSDDGAYSSVSEPVFFDIDPTSGIADATASAALQVSKGATHLRVTGVTVKSLRLHTAGGALAAETASNSIAIAQLPAGVYVLTITTADGTVYSKKISL